MESGTPSLEHVQRFESSVLELGRGIARRDAALLRDGDRAMVTTTEVIAIPPGAAPEDVRRIRLAQDIEFHLRRIACLLDMPVGDRDVRTEPQHLLGALQLALTAYETPEATALARLNQMLEEILADAEPLVRDITELAQPDHLRMAIWHVLAIADSARSFLPSPEGGR
jgi:hypothetical protein